MVKCIIWNMFWIMLGFICCYLWFWLEFFYEADNSILFSMISLYPKLIWNYFMFQTLNFVDTHDGWSYPNISTYPTRAPSLTCLVNFTCLTNLIFWFLKWIPWQYVCVWLLTLPNTLQLVLMDGYRCIKNSMSFGLWF